jgi:NitT/TauT family transport system substrate-binding protein
MKKISLISVLLLVAAVVVACSSGKDQPPPDEVTVQLKWFHQAQFAGFYVAQEQGYYAEENLAVTFIEGGPDIVIPEQVANGEADFGVDAPEAILLQRSQGLPVVAIAVIYRFNPIVFVSMADSGITRSEDLIGHAGAMIGGGGELVLEAMMTRLGLDIGQVSLIPHDGQFVTLVNGDADFTSAYTNGGLAKIYQAGLDVNLIWPSDYGIHFYGDTLFTTDQMIADNPEVVIRFLRATLRGWREAIENPAAAVEVTLQYAPQADSETQRDMMQASIPLVYTGEDQIGWMQAGVWQGMHQILLEQGILDAPIDLDKVYTMQFLETIYAGEQQ